MDNCRTDEGFTAQDHERREWQPRDVILMVLALLALFTLLIIFALIVLFQGRLMFQAA